MAQFLAKMFSGTSDLQSLFLLLNETLKIHLGQKMKLTRDFFRDIIIHNFQYGLSIQECINTHNSFYGTEAQIPTLTSFIPR